MEDGSVEVDIPVVEAECLVKPQSGDGKQSEERCMSLSP